MWKLFIQQVQSLQSRKIYLKLFQCPFFYILLYFFYNAQDVIWTTSALIIVREAANGPFIYTIDTGSSFNFFLGDQNLPLNFNSMIPALEQPKRDYH